jgi:WD40 repeat protein
MGPIHSVDVKMGGRIAISGAADGQVIVWDLGAMRPIFILLSDSDGVNAVALTPKADLALSSNHDKSLKAWNLTNGTLIATFTADAEVRTCACNEDRIIAGDDLGNIHVLALEL